MRLSLNTCIGLLSATMILAPIGGAANNGIGQQSQASQVETESANEEALAGADKQRDLMQKKKKIRESQKSVTRWRGDTPTSVGDQPSRAMRPIASP